MPVRSTYDVDADVNVDDSVVLWTCNIDPEGIEPFVIPREDDVIEPVVVKLPANVTDPFCNAVLATPKAADRKSTRLNSSHT